MLVAKSGAGTTTRFADGGLAVTNAGSVSVTGGALHFDRPTTNTGPLSVSSGEIRFHAPSTQTDVALTVGAGTDEFPDPEESH